MEQDCENWIAYNLFHTQLRMKKDVVPHRNLDGNPDVPRDFSQLTESAQKRKKSNIARYEAKRQKLQLNNLELETVSSSLTSNEPQEVSISFCDKPSTSGLQKSFAHKNVQADIKTVRSIGVNTSTFTS